MELKAKRGLRQSQSKSFIESNDNLSVSANNLSRDLTPKNNMPNGQMSALTNSRSQPQFIQNSVEIWPNSGNQKIKQKADLNFEIQANKVMNEMQYNNIPNYKQQIQNKRQSNPIQNGQNNMQSQLANAPMGLPPPN